MLTHDYSQLPVMTTERDVKGVISWKTIGSRLALNRQCPCARDCMEQPPIVQLEDSIFSAITLRIRGVSRKLNANGRTLFANGVRRSVMLFEWLSPSMGLTTFLTMARFGVSNGSVALATTRACRATPESPSA